MQTCILSYNHPELTAKCVQSVLALVDHENVVLSHNGSHAENIEILKRQFPQIQHFVMNENLGFSGGANETLATAFQKSDWAFFITNDCLLLNPPKTPDESGLYAPLIYRRHINKVDSIGGLFTPFKGRLEHIRNIKKAETRIQRNKVFRMSTFSAFKRNFYVPGTAFYIDKKTFLGLGGFDESLHTYWEDVDLSSRALKQGFHIGIQPKTQLIHKVGKTCHKNPFYTKTLFQRNRKTVSQRYTPSWLHNSQNWLYFRSS